MTTHPDDVQRGALAWDALMGNRYGAEAVNELRSEVECILAAVQQHPMTTEEAAAAAGIDHWQATKRMSDLRNTEQVRDSGDRRKGSSGRAQIVWRVTRPCTCQADHTGEDIIVHPSCDRHGAAVGGNDE